MVSDRFIWCRNCDAVHHVTPFDKAPRYGYVDGEVDELSVTNGCDHLLLRQSRKNINEPLSFELTPGRLVEGVAVCIQDSEIKEEMRCHFKWYADPFEDQKIDLFVQLLRDVVKGIEPEAIEVAGFCSEDDNVTFGLLPAEVIELLMAKCAPYFQPRELDDIRSFIDSHREACDVLALVMRRQLKVEQSAAGTQ